MISPADILNAKILIVDDQQANVTLLEQLLRGGGHTKVTSTMDPEKVCELHLVNHYDLILLDLAMPGMDGFQVMENLKEIEKDYLPVLVLTAQPDHKLRALKSGARDFVSKPFDLAEVLVRVHNMIEVRLMHLELKKLYERVVAEQKVSERLALAGLPAVTAAHFARSSEKASANPDVIIETYAEVTALFADILDFTRFSEGASASVLSGVLNDISHRVESSATERAKVLGDAYLATVGMPDALADKSILAANKALNLTAAMDRFNAHSRYKLNVKIRLETGAPVTAKKKSQAFDL